MTQETPIRPPIRRVALGLLSDYGLVSGDLLVAMVHAETSADADAIRKTIETMQRQGTIYNAAGDADDPEWKVTRP